MRRAHGRRRETARIIASSDRPAVLLRVRLKIDDHVLGMDTELIGNDLRQRGLMSLPLRNGIRDDADRTERIDVDGRGGNGAIFLAGTLAFSLGL